ncbi:hypothetical protein C8R45DRAFT_1102802 [Mycena sanguinolenta]|nr:hypothetical protein C8R45DRAFT_1102802 [Mycena sanguinolenta]
MPTLFGVRRESHAAAATGAECDDSVWKEEVFIDIGSGVHTLNALHLGPRQPPLCNDFRSGIASSRPIFPSSSIVIVTLSVPRFPSPMSIQRPHTSVHDAPRPQPQPQPHQCRPVLTSALRVAVPAAGGAACGLGDAVALGGGFCGDAFTGDERQALLSPVGASGKCTVSWRFSYTSRTRRGARTSYILAAHTPPCVKLNLCAERYVIARGRLLSSAVVIVDSSLSP